jgi:arginase family enzyme
MNILDYLTPLSKDEKKNFAETSFISKHVKFCTEKTHLPAKENFHIALLGLPDDVQRKTFEGAFRVRQELYALTIVNTCRIIDLGNLKPGHNFNDTCFAIKDVITYFNSHKTIVILIGGSSAYNLGAYMAYNQNRTPINMVSIDASIQKKNIPILTASELVLIDNKALAGHFNFVNIGYQSYYVERSMLHYIDDSKFEAHRLGIVRSSLKEMEPVIRDANLISFSLNSLKYSDAPATTISSPNGLTGEEGCQLAFYAGYSTRLQTFGLFDLAIEKDADGVTAKQASQIIWYFLEGYSTSVFEDPDISQDNFTKYHIHFDDANQNIVFYKSNLTNRWWMEVSFSDSNRHIVLSCSQTDYELACRQEIPERWWRMYQRIQS